MKVAIVHDWLYGGGAEKVVEQLHQLYPDAPIYTGSATNEWREKLDNKVITGWPNWWPFRQLRKYLALPLGWWFRSLDLSDYDLIIVSTGNGEAKQIRKTGDAAVVCYCHTPVHFYWRHYQQYLERPGFGLFNPLARLGLKVLVKPLRKRDYSAAQKINHWIANSSAIKSDLNQIYNKDATVIHPPVDIARFQSTLDVQRSAPTPHPQSPTPYFVTVGRLVPYKRVDIIIEACNRLNLPLKVVGRGPEATRLQRQAGENTEIITDASDRDVANYLAEARGFIFAAHEDFGITPVEALASGTPVIAYQAGGALDYISDQTGLFFDEQSAESLVEALQKFDADKFSDTQLRQAAEQFDQTHFQRKITKFIATLLSTN